MEATRARPHFDPDHRQRDEGSKPPAEQEDRRLRGRIIEQNILQQCRQQRDGGCPGHRRRSVAAECRSGGELAANGNDVGERLVEVTHLTPWRKQSSRIYFATQSIPDCKVDASGFGEDRLAMSLASAGINGGRPTTCSCHYRFDWGTIRPLSRLGAFMLRNLLVACLLQAMVQAVIICSAGAAGPYGSIKVGAWIGGAFTDDGTGAFSHCAASTPSASGTTLVVGKGATNAWILG